MGLSTSTDFDISTNGYWLREGRDRKTWKPYDDITSHMIDNSLQDAMNKQKKGLINIKLNAGPYFANYKGIYECNIVVDFSKFGNPIIHKAEQKNIQTNRVRNIKRQQLINTQSDEKFDICNTKWEFQSDKGWKEYDMETIIQIEAAYNNKKKHKMYLDKGAYFSKDPRKYYIIFDYNSSVASCKQVNKYTNYVRFIRRKTPPKWEWESETGWKQYDMETCAQIESAYIKKARKVDLNKGTYFSKHNGTYCVIFDDSKSPTTMTQYNKNTKGPRNIRRISDDNSGLNISSPVKGYSGVCPAIKRIINGLKNHMVSSVMVEKFVHEITEKRFGYDDIVHDVLNTKTMSILNDKDVYNILLDLTTFVIPEDVKEPYYDSDSDSLDDDCEQEACILDDDGMNAIGLAMGGAKDINNFRKSIEQNVMPSVDSITMNGLFYEYYFDTSGRKSSCNENQQEEKSRLFYPTYCYAKCKTLALDHDEKNKNEREYYMSVGLNSNIKEKDFQRKPLNVVILLDKSGSMNSPFDADQFFDAQMEDEWKKRYKVGDKIDVKNGGCWYNVRITEYDGYNTIKVHYLGWENENDSYININSNKLAPFNAVNTKMRCTKRAIVSILNQLRDDDQLSIVTFNNEADIVQPLQYKRDINMTDLIQKIQFIPADGGTNFEKGYKKSKEVLLRNKASKNEAYDNRIITLTDAQPNEGMFEPKQLIKLIDDKFISPTFIGVGLDFNASLVEEISNVRGCNYYSVSSSSEFDDKMNDEFEFMVNPLVFNVCLKLKFKQNIYAIDTVYGLSEDRATCMSNSGEIINIATLFPSKKSKAKGGTKGGIQLIKLKKNEKYNNNKMDVELEVTFEDRTGKKYKNTQSVIFDPPKEKNMLNDMMENDMKENEEMNINFYDNNGIRKAILLCKYVELMKKWIQSDGLSVPLKVGEKYKQIFTEFKEYFKSEMKQINDDTLQQEVDIMEKICAL